MFGLLEFLFLNCVLVRVEHVMVLEYKFKFDSWFMSSPVAEERQALVIRRKETQKMRKKKNPSKKNHNP